MHFGENQLSRSLIGLSPLPTAHPPSFQPRWVRSSTRSYTCFNLAMDRSLRFGSRSCHYNALFRLAFATTTPHGLTSRQNTNSQAHSSKGTPPPHTKGGLKRLVSTRFQVLFHSPPGVLFTIPSRYYPLSVIRRYSGSQVVLADSHRIPRAPCYSGKLSQTRTNQFRLRGYHPLRHAFPDDSATGQHTRPLSGRRGKDSPTTPHTQPLPSITRTRFNHHPLSLATTHGISSPTGTEMFHFPAFPPPPYTRSDDGNPAQPRLGSPIRTPSDNNARSPAPRGISQAATSFISS